MSLILRPFYFLRSMVYLLLVMINTLFFSTLGFIGALFIREPWWGTWIQKYWAKTILLFCNLRVRTIGLENMPRDRGVIYVFNHKSHYDIVAIQSMTPVDLRFGAKAELFRIPVFGHTMKLFGILVIHRAERSRVLELYRQSIERIKRGESFALAPEGTRQEQAELGRFKSGPFIFAASAQADVVPILIYKADQILGARKWIINEGRWSGELIVEILPPISSQGYNMDTWPQLQEHVRSVMEAAYNKGRGLYS